MKITLINTMDVQGGAARAAHRLHKGLCAIGAESTYFVRDRRLEDPTVRQFIPDPKEVAVAYRKERKADLKAAYDRYLDKRDPNIEQFSQERVDGDENFFVQCPPADVINLHWVAGFLDYPLFFSPERTQSPIVWTLHDMNPFTGGCHYGLGCEKYSKQCGACPLLGSNQDNDLTRHIFESKQRIFDAWPSHMLHVVTPSRWLRDTSLSSTLFSKFESTCIPNSIETDIFQPADKIQARAHLGLPVDARIVLFMSHQVGLARKGFRELVHALSLMPDTDNLILLGIGDKADVPVSAPFRVIQIKYVSGDDQVALIYNAADVTAVPSQQDNLPNTMVESLSCGTPVVGFNVGGIPDLVKDGETGFLAPTGNIGALSAAFVEAFADTERLLRFGMQGRALIEAVCAPDVQAKAYMHLYEKVIGSAKLKNVRR